MWGIGGKFRPWVIIFQPSEHDTNNCLNFCLKFPSLNFQQFRRLSFQIVMIFHSGPHAPRKPASCHQRHNCCDINLAKVSKNNFWGSQWWDAFTNWNSNQIQRREGAEQRLCSPNGDCRHCPSVCYSGRSRMAFLGWRGFHTRHLYYTDWCLDNADEARSNKCWHLRLVSLSAPCTIYLFHCTGMYCASLSLATQQTITNLASSLSKTALLSHSLEIWWKRGEIHRPLKDSLKGQSPINNHWTVISTPVHVSSQHQSDRQVFSRLLMLMVPLFHCS